MYPNRNKANRVKTIYSRKIQSILFLHNDERSISRKVAKRMIPSILLPFINQFHNLLITYNTLISYH